MLYGIKCIRNRNNKISYSAKYLRGNFFVDLSTYDINFCGNMFMWQWKIRGEIFGFVLATKTTKSLCYTGMFYKPTFPIGCFWKWATFFFTTLAIPGLEIFSTLFDGEWRKPLVMVVGLSGVINCAEVTPGGRLSECWSPLSLRMLLTERMLPTHAESVTVVKVRGEISVSHIQQVAVS